MSTDYARSSDEWTRAELLARIVTESQRHYADYSLFSQAMADHVGLHPTDMQCVALLDMEPGPVSTGDIARLTGLTSGSATRLVDRMVKAGIVERHADPNDRRRSLVALAPAARDRIGAAWETPAAPSAPSCRATPTPNSPSSPTTSTAPPRSAAPRPSG